MGLEQATEKVDNIQSKEIGETLAKAKISDASFGKSAEKLGGPTLAELKTQSEKLQSSDLVGFGASLGAFARTKNENNTITPLEQADLNSIALNLSKFKNDPDMKTVSVMMSLWPNSPYKTFFTDKLKEPIKTAAKEAPKAGAKESPSTKPADKSQANVTKTAIEKKVETSYLSGLISSYNKTYTENSYTPRQGKETATIINEFKNTIKGLDARNNQIDAKLTDLYSNILTFFPLKLKESERKSDGLNDIIELLNKDTILSQKLGTIVVKNGIPSDGSALWIYLKLKEDLNYK